MTVASEAALNAIDVFVRHEWPRFARKGFHRMQRIPASGIFGDDYRHRTLWDEYCHEVQNGPHDLLEDAWEITVDRILVAIVDAMPPHVAAVLTVDAVLEYEPLGDLGAIWGDGLLRVLKGRLDELAATRSLDRFDTGDW